MINLEEEVKRIKKRKYSRGGCRECKRRKMKCDEGKPHCHNCTRLNKSCIYEVKSKFKFENIHENPPKSEESKSDLAVKFYKPQDKESPTKSPKPESMEQMSFPTVGRQDYQGYKFPGISNEDNNALLNNPDIFKTLDMYHLFDEASLLVNDINHLVSLDLNLNDNTFRANDDTRSEATHKSSVSGGSDTFEHHNFPLEEFADTLIQTPGAELGTGISDKLRQTTSLLIEETIEVNNLVAPHVSYLKTLTTTDLSYHLYPFASSVESNEVVKLLLIYLKDCLYLLTSLLAISATFQYNQTGKRVHDLTRQKYISVCLRSLSEAFTDKDGSKDHSHIAKDIESLLLTVLVLTTNFSATAYTHKETLLNSWKTHLRGAKDLLVSYSKIKKKESVHSRYRSMSVGLALANSWFFAIESIAGLHSSLGGTLAKAVKPDELGSNDSDDETSEFNRKLFIDTGYFDRASNPDYQEALVEAGLQIFSPDPQVSEFNLYVGACVSYVFLAQEFISCLDRLRAHPGKHLEGRKIAKLMSLVHEGQNTTVIPGVNKKTYIIPNSSIGHPEYRGPDRLSLPPSAYTQVCHTSSNVYYSWYDLSHHIHIDYLYLRILTTDQFLQLPSTHPLVEELLHKIMDCTFFIQSKAENPEYAQEPILAESEHFYLPSRLFDNRCIMVQSPFRLCVELETDDLKLEKLELFFMGLVKLGNGSSLAALDQATKYRQRARKLAANESVQDGELAQDSDFIPFA